jgi:hypothetical protein
MDARREFLFAGAAGLAAAALLPRESAAQAPSAAEVVGTEH